MDDHSPVHSHPLAINADGWLLVLLLGSKLSGLMNQDRTNTRFYFFL